MLVVVDHEGLASSAPDEVGAQAGNAEEEGEEDEVVVYHGWAAAFIVVSTATAEVGWC